MMLTEGNTHDPSIKHSCPNHETTVKKGERRKEGDMILISFDKKAQIEGQDYHIIIMDLTVR
jgi:hypothetical protein